MHTPHLHRRYLKTSISILSAITLCLQLLAPSLALAVDAAPAPAPAAAANGLPAGFTDTVLFGGLELPTAVRFASDGRIFVAEKNGKIKIFDSLTDQTPTLFADLGPRLYNERDHGLNGMTLDPGFPGRPYIYVLYSLQGNPGGRLSRLQAAGNTMTGQEQVLVQGWCTIYGSHSAGTLAFANDGSLYASFGDGASFDFVDYGQTPQDDVCGDPVNEGGALRSQDLRTGADPVGMSGSIIRVNPDTGAALPNNPLFGGARTDDDRIVAHGVRNPYRFDLDPVTNELWIGDVGWNNWEEINYIANPLEANVKNLGWPCYEGAGPQDGYQASNLAICQDLYAQNTTTAPLLAYPHVGGSSITGVVRYKGTSNYPAKYTNALFYADFAQEFLRVLLPDANGKPSAARSEAFGQGVKAVDLQVGPGGDVYYVDIGSGDIHRIQYFGQNIPPVAKIQADRTGGPLPLTVRFDAAQSTDQNAGDTLAYAWDLDGDGAFDDATGPNAVFTYTQAGTVTVTVQVSDAQNATDTESVAIYPGADTPTARIIAPLSPSWSSYNVLPQPGQPQARVVDSNGQNPATVSLYESTYDNGVEQGALFPAYSPGAHPDAFNAVETYWGATTGASYPYAGKSTVARGAGANESQVPYPSGVKDLQLHPSNTDKETVAAFTVPQAGEYAISDLAVRRVDGNPGQSVRYRVFDNKQNVLATMRAIGQGWVKDTNTYALGQLAAGEKIYFAVDRDGDYLLDATEISWKVTWQDAPSAPLYRVGDTINFSGAATTGASTALPASALSWTTILHHCALADPNNCHNHPIQSFTGVASASIIAPDHEYPSHLEIVLTATDAQGATDKTSVLLYPRTTTLTFASQPQGAQLTVYGATATTPFTRKAIVNAKTTITANAPQVINGQTHTFGSWSDGGDQTHLITVPATDQTITATFTPPATGPQTWKSENVQVQAAGVSVASSTGQDTAAIQVYEAAAAGSVVAGATLGQFTAGAHPQAFNRVASYRGLAMGETYPYLGKSTVNRGQDVGETNAPQPAGVKDLQMHPGNAGRYLVAAFTVPKDGTYTLSGLAARRVDGAGGETARLRVFSTSQAALANIQATSQAWTVDPATRDLGSLRAQDKVYFALDADGQYYFDAIETAWTITYAGPPTTTGPLVWNSQDIVAQAGAPSIRATNGTTATTLSLYESANIAGVDPGTALGVFTNAAHGDAFNRLSSYWSAGPWYGYVGKSSVARGADTGETNTPTPTGAFDLQLHPGDSDKLTVVAFTVPQAGTYSLSNLAARRVDGTAGYTSRYKVFTPAKTVIANLRPTSQAWVRDITTKNLGALNAGDKVYFTVERDGNYYYDATEITWTITKN